MPLETTTTKPLVSIGWVLAADLRDGVILDAYEQARQHLLQALREQFPQFRWEAPAVNRRRFAPRGALPPLPLLELGVQEKLQHRWDYALVIVPNELKPQRRTFTIGVPSSALETATLSSVFIDNPDEIGERLAALALHLLGHLWGLEHDETGPMESPESMDILHMQSFSPQQQQAVEKRLAEVADARLEEQLGRWGAFSFYMRTFGADPQGILIDIWGYAPWQLPFRMARFTAAAAVSVFFLLLGAESWEVGVNFTSLALGISFVAAVLSATIFIFYGQNLGHIARASTQSEQLARTHIVLFCSLMLGVLSLWLTLFLVSYIAATIVPQQVPANWIGRPLDFIGRGRYAAFLATLGVLASALGGNLEDEDEFKTELFYDEET
jgi:predicted Zn-dependent protease